MLRLSRSKVLSKLVVAGSTFEPSQEILAVYILDEGPLIGVLKISKNTAIFSLVTVCVNIDDRLLLSFTFYSSGVLCR